MTATIEETPTEPAPPSETPPRGNPALDTALRIVGIAVFVLAVVGVVRWAYNFLLDREANRGLVVLVAIGLGVFGVFGVFWAMNRVVDWLPRRVRDTARSYVFVGPALVILSVFLIYPVVNTILISLQDRSSQEWVGLDNYEFIFTNDSTLRAIRNSALWIVVVPAVAVTVGLVFATLADRLRRGEAVAKSLIFLPMAISFVGAAVTWRLIYSFRPTGFGTNIGLLNSVKIGLGQEPVAWLNEKPWNNLMLMVIMIWMQTGFAMVVLSAAIKAVPDEIIEAARIDGATEWQVFRRILIPSILPTVVVVTTYMVINALKVFDIVFVMGNAETQGTEVIAERMIRWFFIQNHNGRGAAIAVVLFVAIIPVMIWNVRGFRQQESVR